MFGEDQALTAWARLLPTVCDTILLGLIFYIAWRMSKTIQTNKEEREKQILDLEIMFDKQLTAIRADFREQLTEIRNTFTEHLSQMNQFLQELKDGKTQVELCDQRHKEVDRRLDMLDREVYGGRHGDREGY